MQHQTEWSIKETQDLVSTVRSHWLSWLKVRIYSSIKCLPSHLSPSYLTLSLTLIPSNLSLFTPIFPPTCSTSFSTYPSCSSPCLHLSFTFPHVCLSCSSMELTFVKDYSPFGSVSSQPPAPPWRQIKHPVSQSCHTSFLFNISHVHLRAFCAVTCALCVCVYVLFSRVYVFLVTSLQKLSCWDITLLWPPFDMSPVCVCVCVWVCRWSMRLTPGSLRNPWCSRCVIRTRRAQRSQLRSVVEHTDAPQI